MEVTDMTDFSHIPDPVMFTDPGQPAGERYPAAVKSWFTTTGSITPLSFKFKGEDGVMQYISHVEILESRERSPAGIPSLDYSCRSLLGGLYIYYHLLYYPGICKWVMVYSSSKSPV